MSVPGRPLSSNWLVLSFGSKIQGQSSFPSRNLRRALSRQNKGKRWEAEGLNSQPDVDKGGTMKGYCTPIVVSDQSAD